MWKGITVSVACLLVIGSGAGGSIIVQTQGVQIGTVNAIDLLHGDQEAGSSQNLVLVLTQDGGDMGGLFGDGYVIGLTSPFGAISRMTVMTGIADSLRVTGLVSPWTLNSLADQSRLHLLMLSAN
jgi:hypothetical protein